MTEQEKIEKIKRIAEDAIFFLSAGAAMCHVAGDKENSEYLLQKHQKFKQALSEVINDK